MGAASIQQRLNLKRFFQGDAPTSAPYVLGQRNVYILPTRHGLFFGFTLLIILLGAINYSNSLGYLLTFLLGSVAVVGILHTYRNLLHLSVRTGSIEPVYCGSDARVPVIIDNPRQAARFNVSLQAPQQEPRRTDIPADQRHIVHLSIPATRRGWQPLGRITLSTTFPLGLFRAWSHVVLDERFLVYPTPARQAELPATSQYMASLLGDQGIGSDDFAGLRGFRSGDSLKHIHWKALARQQGLQTKLFGGDRNEQLWLDWRMLEGLDIEQRLSQLCRWVIEAERQGMEYGLWLPDQSIEPDRGQSHQSRCLRALALFG